MENYLIIQSMRYADKFTYEIFAQPEVESCGIIKLILQPIVENCIYHGIKKKRGTGHISIEAFRQDEYLKIFVKRMMAAERVRKYAIKFCLMRWNRKISVVPESAYVM